MLRFELPGDGAKYSLLQVRCAVPCFDAPLVGTHREAAGHQTFLAPAHIKKPVGLGEHSLRVCRQAICVGETRWVVETLTKPNRFQFYIGLKLCSLVKIPRRQGN